MDTLAFIDKTANPAGTHPAGRFGRGAGPTLLVLACLALAAGPVTRAHAEKAPAGKAKPEAGAETAKPKPPSPLHHVKDTARWEFFETFGPKLHLWSITGHQLTKFMVLEVIAAVLIAAIYIPLAQRLRTGQPPRGAWQNTFEVLLTFIRDDVAKPSFGEHEADRYVPYLWTLFLFVLFCNLLGMIPFAGSPTADIFVTGALALCSFVAIHGAAVAKMGFVPYVKSMWPHLDIPIPVVGTLIKAMIAGIEFMGIGIKSVVLAVRLFANMFAGHMVLATILLFIVMAAHAAVGLVVTITIGSVVGVAILSLLELFVAFLQAYIFVFLTALFMGMAVHPQH
jgi:F-type H+-transporting ATPase subunit a